MDDSKDQNQANILEVSKECLEKLWNRVEQAKQGSNTFASAPMEEIYEDPNQCRYGTNSICGYIGLVESQESIDEDLNEMPQYLGEHEAKSEIRVLPSAHKKPKQEKDTINLTALLSTPIECRLTLGELLKVRPNLWNDLAKTLQNMGIKST